MVSKVILSLKFLLTFGDCSPKVNVSVGLSSRTVSRKVFSPLQSLTSVFGMGTGGPSAFMTLTLSKLYSLNIEQQFPSKLKIRLVLSS